MCKLFVFVIHVVCVNCLFVLYALTVVVLYALTVLVLYALSVCLYTFASTTRHKDERSE